MKIGELERITGITKKTVRYWEERGLISAERADNRYREYVDEDISLLLKIKGMRELGIALADIKLWRDGVVSERSLLLEHRKRMDSDSRENRRLRELCDRLIEGKSDSASESSAPFAEPTDESDSDEKLLLGVDIGTTSISAKLVAASDGRSIHTYSISHATAFGSEHPAYIPDAFAADAEQLLEITLGLIRSAVGAYPTIAAIGLTGQMHGIVCLNSDGEPISPLYTWQNQFGLRSVDGETICERILRLTGRSVPTGYGLVTLYALGELGLLPAETARVACISDVAVMKLCGDKAPVCHPTNAASLGFYDLGENRFETDLLARLGIPAEILPKVAPDFGSCGCFEGIPVAASIGDNQAGVFGSLADEASALLNVGTSGQISLIGGYEPPERCLERGYELRPYLGGKFLLSGSVLCGGRALELLARLIGEVAGEFGASPTKNQLYECINRLAARSQGRLRVSTVFAGTRLNPDLRGSICGIGVEDFTLAELSGGFIDGIIGELYELSERMSARKVESIVISGNAIRRSSAMRASAERIFGCTTRLPQSSEEAAFGAALCAGISAGVLTLEGSRKLISYE